MSPAGVEPAAPPLKRGKCSYSSRRRIPTDALACWKHYKSHPSVPALAALGRRPAPLDRPYTVADAIADYRIDYLRRGGKAADRLDWSAAAWIIPELGQVWLAGLTKARIVAWHQKLAETPERLRTRAGAAQKHREADRGPEMVSPTPLGREPDFDDPQGCPQPRAPRGGMRQ